MNFQQLQYIIAINEHRHFVRAAEVCHVTQPTLSAMVHKLEEELGVLIFDRTKQPVSPTPEGVKIIAQAHKILAEVRLLQHLPQQMAAEPEGELHIGIISTLAPYLLHLILPQFLKLYPKVKLVVKEYATAQILEALQKGTLDCGILATPLQTVDSTVGGFYTEVLFYERLLVYLGKENPATDKEYILQTDLDPARIWLLEEGHCLRSQVMQLCALREQAKNNAQLIYEAGSIESLLNLVDTNAGITLVPELAVRTFDETRSQQVRQFAEPEPLREISIVASNSIWKQALRTLLCQVIAKAIEPMLTKKAKTSTVVPVTAYK